MGPLTMKKIKKVTVFLEGETGGMVYNNPAFAKVYSEGDASWLLVRLNEPPSLIRDNIFNYRFVRTHVVEWDAGEPGGTAANE